MWEYVIIGVIVAGAVAHLVLQLVRGAQAKGCGCGANDCSSESARKTEPGRLGKRRALVRLNVDQSASED